MFDISLITKKDTLNSVNIPLLFTETD